MPDWLGYRAGRGRCRRARRARCLLTSAVLSGRAETHDPSIPSSPEPLVGEVVADRFVIEGVAGRGGMGVVYRARDLRGDAPVALKLLALGGEENVARFRREARLLAALQHPCIVRHVDEGLTARGDFYLAMEWLDGHPLSTYSASEDQVGSDARPGASPGGPRVGIADAVALVRRVSEALAVAHSSGVIHRDVKPANVFLRGGRLEHVVLLDFGLARPTTGGSLLTRTGAVIGTPAYMSPEQAAGQVDVDARADVFSLGCILYELVTGVSPFRADTFVATLARVLLEDPPLLRALAPTADEALESLVARMLSKTPADRPGDAAEVAEALGALPEGAEGRTPAASPTLGEAERRVVSVALVRGAMHGTAKALSARFLARIVDLAPDLLLATFSGGSAADQAERAVSFASSIAATPHSPRVAVTTGMTDLRVAGAGGARQAVASIGDAVARAVARLNEGGDLLDIQVDEVTERLMSSRHAPGRHPPRLVGRARELALLTAMYEECVAEPIARVALVLAPAGMGKSHLLAELETRLARSDSPPTVLHAPSAAITEGSSFAALAVAIRGAAAISSEDHQTRAVEKLATYARAIAPAEDAGRLAQFLGEVAGAPFPADDGAALLAARHDRGLRGDQMRRAVEDWLGFACKDGPVLLVLEDLHWGDAPTVQAIDAALRRLARRPFMVVALARPEVRRAFPGLWSERAVTEVALGPLAPSAAAALVRARLGSEAEGELVDALLASADGHPFLLDELARAAGEGRTEWARHETAIAVAHGTLDRVEPDGRRVLRAASVFGGAFGGEGVAELLGGAEGVRSWLDELERRELLRRASDERAVNAYVFRHDLLREAAYATLTEEDRRLAHELAGRHLEATGHDDAIALARHFERGNVLERAVHWYRRSAELALEGNDVEAVVERTRVAIEAGATGEELGRVHLLRAEAHMWRGDNQAAKEHARWAMGLLQPGSREWFRAASEAAAAAGKLRRQELLLPIVDDLLAVDPTLELDAARIAWARTALQLSNFALFERADALLERIEAAGGAAAATPLAAGYIHSAIAYRGEEVARVRHGERAVLAFEAAGHARNACLESLTVGHGLLELGAFGRWLPRLTIAKATAERLGLRQPAALATMQLAGVHLGIGELEKAARFGEEARATFLGLHNPFLAAVSASYLGNIAFASGDLQAAEAHLRGALAACVEVFWQRAYVEATLARALAVVGRTGEALATARAAQDSLQKGGARTTFKGVVRLAISQVLYAAGLLDEARAALREARDQLLARAAVLDDELRAGFLSAIPEHPETLEWAARWLDRGINTAPRFQCRS